MEEVYDFASLAFAAMPYRFLYLSVNEWFPALIILGIKYMYKVVNYFLSLKFRKQIKILKIKVKAIFLK
jgi:hypothetical protein